MSIANTVRISCSNLPRSSLRFLATALSRTTTTSTPKAHSHSFRNMSFATASVLAVSSVSASPSSASASASTSTSTSTSSTGSDSSPLSRRLGGKGHLVVTGGNGYVGSHVIKEALKHGLHVTCISRSGAPHKTQLNEEWTKLVTWKQGDVLNEVAVEAPWKQILKQDVDAVISVVGGFGNIEQMVRINGDANCNVMRAAAEASVPRFVFVSAHSYVLPDFMKQGYFAGKYKAESCLESTFGPNGVAVKPSFVYGVRNTNAGNLPLHLLGAPLEKFTRLRPVAFLSTIPLIGPVLAPALVPPVNVEHVAKACVKAAFDPTVKNKLDVDDIAQIGQSPLQI